MSSRTRQHPRRPGTVIIWTTRLFLIAQLTLQGHKDTMFTSIEFAAQRGCNFMVVASKTCARVWRAAAFATSEDPIGKRETPVARVRPMHDFLSATLRFAAVAAASTCTSDQPHVARNGPCSVQKPAAISAHRIPRYADEPPNDAMAVQLTQD